MYTQVEYEELVKETLSRIGTDLGMQFDEPPAPDEVMSYPRGKWVYETDGPSVMEVEVYRWGEPKKRGGSVGCHWTEDRLDYQRRLESELRAAVLKLVRIDEHDEGCAGCNYELRRQLNGFGVRIRDYSAMCAQCSTAIVGEFEHHIHGRSYCGPCLGLWPLVP